MCSNRTEGNWLKRLASRSGHIDAILKDVFSVRRREDKCLNNEVQSNRERDDQRWVTDCQTVGKKGFHQRGSLPCEEVRSKGEMGEIIRMCSFPGLCELETVFLRGSLAILTHEEKHS